MVSVIVPVYNVKSYLAECVTSLLNLTFEIEIILVDDGSSDGSGAMCDEFALKDSRIKVVHQQNKGLSAARNEGVRNALGEYVMFIDSDDFVDSKSCDELLSNTRNASNVVIGLYNNYYTESNSFEPENCPELLALNGVVSSEDFLNSIHHDGQSTYMVAVRFIVKRQFLIDNNLFFLEGIYHEDEEWTARLLCKTEDVFVCHSYFYQYRQARPDAMDLQSDAKRLLTKVYSLPEAPTKVSVRAAESPSPIITAIIGIARSAPSIRKPWKKSVQQTALKPPRKV